MTSNLNAPPKILFSSTLFTPFIEDDAMLLSRHYNVETLIAKGLRALFRIPGAVLRSQITLSWFGSVYAGYTVFLAKVFGRKSIVIVAGVDASKDKEIHYGIWLSPWKSIFVRYAFRNADRVLVVDPFLQKEAIRLAEYDGANILNIPFGFDGTQWKPGGAKEDMVLTVAACEDHWRMKKKGIDKLFEAALQLPAVRFCVIGIASRLIPEAEASAPSNVELISFVPRNELLPYYQMAKVYCQPSFTEGLPNTLCEAMLCGCIPVGTIAGGIPTAMGSTGFLVSYHDQAGLVRSLKEALASPESKGEMARKRILTEFTIPKRELSMLNVINDLIE